MGSELALTGMVMVFMMWILFKFFRDTKSIFIKFMVVLLGLSGASMMPVGLLMWIWETKEVCGV